MGSKMKEAKPNFRQLKLSSWSVAQQEFVVVSLSYSVLEILAKVWTSRGGIRGSRNVCEGNRTIVVTKMKEGRVEKGRLNYSV